MKTDTETERDELLLQNKELKRENRELTQALRNMLLILASKHRPGDIYGPAEKRARALLFRKDKKP